MDTDWTPIIVFFWVAVNEFFFHISSALASTVPNSAVSGHVCRQHRSGFRTGRCLFFVSSLPFSLPFGFNQDYWRAINCYSDLWWSVVIGGWKMKRELMSSHWLNTNYSEILCVRSLLFQMLFWQQLCFRVALRNSILLRTKKSEIFLGILWIYNLCSANRAGLILRIKIWDVLMLSHGDVRLQ